jgi:capsular exopolysaccharide synthesis family protein
MDTNSYAHRINEGTSASMTQNDGPDAGVDLRAWFGALRRRKVLLAAITLIGTVVAYFIIDGMTPLYTSSVEVLIEGQEQNVVEFNAVVEGMTLDPGTIGSQVEVLQSRSLAGKVVDELGLMDDPEFNPALVESEYSLLDEIDPAKWLAALGLGSGQTEAVALAPEQAAIRERETVINAYLGRLLVETVPFTYVLEISFTSEEPDKAALIANTTADLYILEQLEAKFEATQQANSWLSRRLEQLRQDVIAADNELTDYQTEYSLGGEQRQSLIEQQLNSANGELMQARADRAEAQARLQQMQNLVARSGPASVGAVLESSMVQGLQTRLAEARRELAELSTRYGDLHPEIINIKAEIADLESTIDVEVQKVLQNLENEVEIAQAREASVRQTVENLKSQFDSEQSAEVGRLELEREAEAARTLYDTMLARYKEVSEQEEIQQPDARVISTAIPSGKPSWPLKKLFLAGAFVVSFFIAIGVVVILEILGAGFRTIEDAERVLGARALGEVPMMSGLFRSDPEKSIVADPNSSFAEAIRGLSTALMLTDVDRPPKLIAVASSLSEEGKTSIAIALARLMAMGTRTVLLIDGDLRKPRIHRELGMVRSPGLSDVIANELPLLDAVNVEESTGLHFLSAGTDMPNPQDLLHSKRAKATFDLLREAYDTVIVDTPAIMPVSDGLLLTHLADATVFLVRWENTPRNVAARALKKVESSGADIAGIVLSRVNRRKQASYGGRTDAYYYGRY